MKRTQSVAAATFVLFLLSVLLYVFHPFGENFYIFGDSFVIALSFMAFLSGFYAYKSHGFASSQGRALLFMTLGVFFWFLGEFTWGFYEMFLVAEKPVASLADVFWFIGYPLYLAGIYFIAKTASPSIGKRKLIILSTIALLISILMVYLALPNLTDATLSFEEKISTGGYIIGDIFLLIGIIFVTGCLWGSRFAKAWSVLLFAMVLSTVADICYAIFFSVYETGNLIDILWNLDYLLMAFGFFYYRETIKQILASAKGTIPAKAGEMKKS